MIMKFAPRPGYENVQGVLAYGAGQVWSVHEALASGEGSIVTEDPHLQQVLSDYRGADGPVFDVSIIDHGEETPVERPPEPEPKKLRTPTEAATEMEKGTPQHPAEANPDQSGYALLPDEELQQIVEARGLSVPAGASKESLIALIEQHDAAEAAGTGA